MRVGLIDVDGHNFPNLCLMKLAAWHKAQGDAVEWHNALVHYDRVYMSRVFDDTYSKDIDYPIDPFVMIYDKPHAPKEIKRLARWVNNRLIWRSCERFEDYNG